MNLSYEIELDPQQDPDGRWYPQARVFYDLGDGQMTEEIIGSENDPSFDTEEEAASYSEDLAQKFLAQLVRD